MGLTRDSDLRSSLRATTWCLLKFWRLWSASVNFATHGFAEGKIKKRRLLLYFVQVPCMLGSKYTPNSFNCIKEELYDFLDKLNFLDCLHFLKSYVLHSQNSYLSPFPIKSYTNHPLYSLHAEGLTRTERNKNLSILMRIFKLSTCQSFLHKIVQIFIAEFVLFCRFLGHGVLLSDRLLCVDYGHRFCY